MSATILIQAIIVRVLWGTLERDEHQAAVKALHTKIYNDGYRDGAKDVLDRVKDKMSKMQAVFEPRR